MTYKVSVLHFVPSLFDEFLASLNFERGRACLSSLRAVFTSGEALSASTVQRFYQLQNQAGTRTRLINLYGPTEAAVEVTLYETKGTEDILPIGCPVANTQIYVVDAHLHPVPIGVAGELLIGGVQVSRGYLGRSGLTAEKFIADPFSGKSGARLYCSGDLARWRPDGTLDYLGRMDHQVKIRGMRVELGGIEAVLSSQDGIAQAAVTVDGAGSQARLVACLVPEGIGDVHIASAVGKDVEAVSDLDRQSSHVLDPEALLDIRLLRAQLKTFLPEHMVPGTYVVLSRLPLTPSGKLDRKALPVNQSVAVQTVYEAPRTEREALICQIMRDVIAHDRLHLERVGLTDNFFDIGGHSIFAAQFAMRLEKALGVHVPVRLVFEHPRVREFVQALETGIQGEALPPVLPVERQNPIPASFEQERMWLANTVYEGKPVYNEGLPISIKGAVNTQALLTAVQGVLDRYEVLRTKLLEQDGQLIQQVNPVGSVTQVFEDWSGYGLTAKDLECRAIQHCAELISAPYNLGTEYPCRSLVLKLGEDWHVWCLAIHHSVGDNWSLSHVMPSDFFALYETALSGGTSNLPEITLHYADYAAWQRSKELAPVLAKDLEWWHKQLAGLPQVLDLPSDRSRPPQRSSEGQRIQAQSYSPQLWRAVEEFAVSHDGTPFMVFVAALSGLLSRVCRTDDIVLGTPHVMKPDAALWDEFGYFGNTLALRTKVEGDDTFEGLFTRARNTVMGAIAHQYVPFEDIVSAQEASPSNVTPIFQVLLVMHAYADAEAFKNSGLILNMIWEAAPKVSKYDLSVDINPGTDGVQIFMEYASDIFEEETVRRLGDMFKRFICGALQAPHAPIAKLDILGDGERQQVLKNFNETQVDYPSGETVLDLIARQVEAHPQAIAVTDNDSCLTYAELDGRSNQLARYLIAQGVGPEQIVGVCLERSVELIVVLLGVFKSGGVYLPFSLDYPLDRLEYMLADVNADHVIVSQRGHVRLAAMLVNARYLVTVLEPIHSPNWLCNYKGKGKAAQIFGGLPSADILAYIIYTSGSSGKPKAVPVCHGPLTNLLLSMKTVYAIKEGEGALVVSEPVFDAFIERTLVPLISGGWVSLRSLESLLHEPLSSSLFSSAKVAVYGGTPTIIETLIEHCAVLFEGARAVAGGEALRTHLSNKLFSLRSSIINSYGPTETTITASYYSVGAEDNLDILPIGSPVANTQIYVVDAHLHPVPIGVAGELLIGGVQVSRGYLGRSGLTAEKFIADPFSGKSGARLYCSGDLARWRPDGTLDYLGRMDHQVKIRGMRVELGGIEAVLSSQDGIAQAAVTVDGAGSQARLVACLVPEGIGDVHIASAVGKDVEAVSDLDRQSSHVLDPEALLDIRLLRAQLKTFLPEHMVPGTYVVLSRLPLTPSGKLDRKALPVNQSVAVQTVYEAPRTEREALICQIMRDVIAHDRLHLERVGLADNFFDIGGHSIFAAQFAMRLEKALGVHVPVRLVFEHPRVREFVQALETGIQGEALPPVLPVERQNPIPASFEQERMWLANTVYEGKPVYNEGLPISIKGAVNTQALLTAVQGVLDRYEVLRTRLVERDEGLFQLIDPPGNLKLVFEDWSGSAHLTEKMEQDVKVRCSDLIAAPYNLGTEYPCRSLVLKLGEDWHVWCLAIHHSVGDNWSLSHVMPSDFFALYETALSGGTSNLPEITLHYADYAAWQRSKELAPVLAKDLEWWHKQLAGLPQALDLPFDRPRPSLRNFAGHLIQEHFFSIEDWRAIESFSVRHGGTPFMVFVAALSGLLSRVCRTDDIVLGTPHVMKPDAALWDEFGYFGNTLVLRSNVKSKTSFENLFDNVRDMVMEAFAHQYVPFEWIVKRLKIAPSNTTPLFQVLLTMHAYGDEGGDKRPDMTLEVLEETSPKISKFDLSVDVYPGSNGIHISLEYASDVFEEITVRRLGNLFKRFMCAAFKTPSISVGELNILSEAECQQIVNGFNTSQVDYPVYEGILDLFTRQVWNQPETSAVFDGDRCLNYRELDVQSNMLASSLMAEGVGLEQVVGVCLERSIELVVSLLAIWKAGGAYLPLDPDYPHDRILYLLKDADAKVLIVQKRHSETLSECAALNGFHPYIYDEGGLHSFQYNSGEGFSEVEGLQPYKSDRLAYVLYTSGSTGKPKGVMVSHKELYAFVSSVSTLIELTEKDVVWSVASASFDVSIQDFCLSLAGGSKMVLFNRTRFGSRDYVTQLLETYPPTFMELTPSVFGVMFPDGLPFLPDLTMFIGSEVVEPGLASKLLGQVKSLFNAYGPTETVVNSIMSRIGKEDFVNSVPIGFPLPNTKAYVVDTFLNPVPIGIAGELVIGGVQVALGYLGLSGLTADKFIADPFSKKAGERLYRSGDLARWRRDGQLEYLGRMDQQVKIRGMRVELSEIESVLIAQPGISQAVVVVDEVEGQTRIIACVVPEIVDYHQPTITLVKKTEKLSPREDRTLDVESLLDIGLLRAQLKILLPLYMVPSHYVALSRLPLLSSGKVDRKSLPIAAAVSVHKSYEAPETASEIFIAATFAQLLGLERVGRQDSFFDLGGDSMSAVRLIERLKGEGSCNLGVRDVLEKPTVSELAKRLSSKKRSYSPLIHFVAPRGLERGAQTQQVILCFHAADGLGYYYGQDKVLREWGQYGKVIGVRARGWEDNERFFINYDEMIDCYTGTIIKEVTGPLFCVGWSDGGVIAQDVAVRLQKLGRDVKGLVILDSLIHPSDDEKENVTRYITGDAPWSEVLDQLYGELYEPEFNGKHQFLSDNEKLKHILDVLTFRKLIPTEVSQAPRAFAERLIKNYVTNLFLLAKKGKTEVFNGPTLVLRGLENINKKEDPTLGWPNFCSRIDIADTLTSHDSFLKPVTCREVVDVVSQWMGSLSSPKEE